MPKYKKTFKLSFGDEIVNLKLSEKEISLTCTFNKDVPQMHNVLFRLIEMTAVVQETILRELRSKDKLGDIANACEVIINLERAVANDDREAGEFQILKGLDIVNKSINPLSEPDDIGRG